MVLTPFSNNMKALLPSLREKKRYLAFEVLSDKKLKESSVRQAVWNASLSYHGVKGTAQAGLVMVPEQWNEAQQRGLVKVNHKQVDAMKAAMLFITHIEHQPAIVKSRGVSGVLRKAVNRYIAG